jgi:glycine/D-amino acid oxidase-like deaminating enzyme
MRKVMGADDPAAEYEILDGEENKNEINTRFLTPGEDVKVAGAVVYQAGSISAYRFTIEVLKRCVDMGLDLHTNTPVTSIQQDSQQWTINTDRGNVSARSVILATNAHTAHLLPQFQGKIVPLRGQITAQARGPKLAKLKPCGPDHTYSFVYPSGYEYMIPRPFMPSVPEANRGDFVIGGGLGTLDNEGLSEYGNTDDTVLNTQNSVYLKDTLVRYFGSNWGSDDPSFRVKSEWTGIMGITGDGLPYVGEVPGRGGLWVSAGFNGHGMVMCLKSAEALVHMMFCDKRCCDKGEMDWFPSSFGITEERLNEVKFEGRKGMRIQKAEAPEPYFKDGIEK